MADLIESRISEIRTDYALAHDLLDTAAWISSIAPETTHVMRVVQAVMYLQGKAASRPSPESVAHLIRVDPWACAIAALVRQHDRSDLEALLAEREGMKAEIERLEGCNEDLRVTQQQTDEMHRARYTNLRDALGVKHPTAEEIVGASIAAIHERNRLRAPLDPSSAPTNDLAELFNMIARRDPSVTAELFDTREFGERAARIYAALGEPSEQRVARIFDEARRQMKPKIDAELQAENITSEIMDFRMRSPDREAGSGTAFGADEVRWEVWFRKHLGDETKLWCSFEEKPHTLAEQWARDEYGRVMDWNAKAEPVLVRAVLHRTLAAASSHPVPSEGGGE